MQVMVCDYTMHIIKQVVMILMPFPPFQGFPTRGAYTPRGLKTLFQGVREVLGVMPLFDKLSSTNDIYIYGLLMQENTTILPPLHILQNHMHLTYEILSAQLQMVCQLARVTLVVQALHFYQ